LAHRLLGRCETLAKQVIELQEKLQAAEDEVVRLTKALQVADHQLAYFLGERDL
jgi:phage shock protein A